MGSPFDQSRYQVRLDWGAAGLRRLSASDVVVIVDVLRFSTAVTVRVAAGEQVSLDDEARAASLNGASVASLASAHDEAPTVLLGCLRNASAVAAAVVAEQRVRARRTSVAVIACGEVASAVGDASLRFAVEDLLGAGAVISALGAAGLDHTSPEAAAAAEAFRGLHRATGHLLSACGSGQELLERGAREEVSAAAVVDADAAVPVLRAGVFVAY